MLFQEGAEEETQVLDEILLVVLSVGIGEADIGVQRKHLPRQGTGLNLASEYRCEAVHLLVSRPVSADTW